MKMALVAMFVLPALSQAQECPALRAGLPSHASVAPDRPACLTIDIGYEPLQLMVDQPVDVEIRIAGKRTDAFTLGPESATFATPGQYRVEIRQVNREPRRVSSVAVSLRAVDAHRVLAWSGAEEAGTRAKQSGKAEDLAAAVAAWEETGDLASIGRTHLDQGDAALAAASLAAAHDFYEAAWKVCAAAAYTRCQAEAANNSGFTSLEMGAFEPALTRLSEAAAEFGQVGEPDPQGRALTNIGLLFRQTGDYQQAIRYYERARVLLGKGDPVATARVLNNIGVCYQYLAEYEEASGYFERAMPAFDKFSPRDAGRVRLNLGRTYLLDGRAAQAKSLLADALARAETLSDVALRGDALNNMGQAFLAMGDAGGARARLEPALEIHRASGDRRLEALDLHFLGAAAKARGDAAQAREFFEQAYEIRRSCGLRDGEADSLFELAGLERAEGNAGTAKTLAENGLALLESVRSQAPAGDLRAAFYAHKRRFLDLLVDLEAAGSPEAGLLAADRGKGRALLDLLSDGKLHPLSKDLETRRSNIEHEIGLVSLRLASAPAGRAADLRRRGDALAAEEKTIEAGVRESMADQRLGQPFDSLEELRAALPAQTALIEYWLGERESYLWLVEAKRMEMFRLPGRAEIEARCAPFLRLFPAILERKRSRAAQRRFERELASVSALLIAPLGLAVPAHLVLVPDGVLTEVPFAALETSAHRRLGLTSAMVQVPSAAFLAAGRKPRRLVEFPKSFLVVADPVFSSSDPRVARPVAASASGGLARIPFHQELDVISAMVPPPRLRVLRGFEANPAALVALPLKDFGVLHFSTHALIDDRVPELSRMALSLVGPNGETKDGFLRPHQLSQLSLSGSTVVISACDSALGKQVSGEGLAGFTASLFSAGAAQLVVTVSDVDAEASSALLAEAYRHLLSGESAAMDGALVVAAKAMARNPRWADPYYWAVFAVHGLPGAD
jgi:CHAT domain-containing protein/tetratricopeptide (TPR) repeat protein